MTNRENEEAMRIAVNAAGKALNRWFIRELGEEPLSADITEFKVRIEHMVSHTIDQLFGSDYGGKEN